MPITVSRGAAPKSCPPRVSLAATYGPVSAQPCLALTGYTTLLSSQQMYEFTQALRRELHSRRFVHGGRFTPHYTRSLLQRSA